MLFYWNYNVLHILPLKKQTSRYVASKWPKWQYMRNAGICDKATEGWSGRGRNGHGEQLQLWEEKARSRRLGNGAAAPARKLNSQIQLSKESMEIQTPPVGEGQKEAKFGVSEKCYYTECNSLVRKSWHSWILTSPLPGNNESKACTCPE